MNSKLFHCPICNSRMKKTDYYNPIYNKFNYYCSYCESYHVTEPFNDKEYYESEYQNNFNYKLDQFRYKIIGIFPFFAFRGTSRFDFLKKYITLPKKLDILEIGGGTGEHFIVFNRRTKVSSYKIVEPGPIMETKHSKLKHYKDVFENLNINEFGNPNIVMMFHVLEHIFDLDTFFERIRKIEPNYFYFEVPNIANEKVKIGSMTENPHYHHFSKKSLRMLMNKYGLHEIQLQGVEPKSYHPHKHVPFFKKYRQRLFHNNEIYNIEKGIYTRGIYSFKAINE